MPNTLTLGHSVQAAMTLSSLPKPLFMLPSLLLTVAILGCGDDPQTGVIASLSEDEHREIMRLLDTLEDDSGFAPLYPDSLPDGFGPAPLVSVQPVGDTAWLEFHPGAPSALRVGAPIVVLVIQHGGLPVDDLACDTLHSTPLDPDRVCMDLTVGGVQIVSGTQVQSPDKVNHTAQGVIEGRQVSVTVIWNVELASPAALDDEMTQVAFDILTSLRPFE